MNLRISLRRPTRLGLLMTGMLAFTGILLIATGRIQAEPATGTDLAPTSATQGVEPSPTAPALDTAGAAPSATGLEETVSVFRDDPLASLANALRQKELELEEKDKALQTAERRIEDLRQELEQTLGKTESVLREMQRIASDADTKRKQEQGKWIKIYQSMPPESAAKVMEGLQSDYALEILAQMDPKKSSKILAALVQNKPEKAAELTKKLESR